MEELNRQQTMPALALRGLTVFPQMLLHFDVGRQASIQALDESMASGQPIFLVAQRELAQVAGGDVQRDGHDDVDAHLLEHR